MRSPPPPPALDRRLASIRARWILRDHLLAAAGAVLALVPPCLALGPLDHAFRFSASLRILEWLGLVAWAVLVLRRASLRALRPRPRAAVALLVEGAFPRFAGRLASAVEFRGGPGSPGRIPSGASPSLAESLCARMEREAAPLPIERAIDLAPARRPTVAAGIVLAIAAATVVLEPGLSWIWLQRTLIPWAGPEWPRRTRIEGLPDRYLVRRGDPIRVEGRVAGEVPARGSISWKSRTKPAGIFASAAGGSLSFDIARDGSFAATVGPLLEPADLSVSAGDGRRDGIPVEVVVPPEIEAVEARLTFPPFTGRPEETVRAGDVRALVGTRVLLTVTADRLAERMEAAFDLEGGSSMEPLTPASPRRGTVAFTVRSRGRYGIRLYDAHGFSSPPATFVIEPVENGSPAVAVLRPGAERVVAPATRLRIEFDAADDFGIARAAIRWKKVPPGSGPAAGPPGNTGDGGFAVLPIPQAGPRRAWKGDYVWDLAAADLRPGDEITYLLEVADEGEHLALAAAGRSRMQVLKVVDPEVLRRSLEEKVREGWAELERTARDQAASRDAVAAALLDLSRPEEPLGADLGRVEFEENRQKRLVRQIERIAERLESAAGELAESFLADGSRIDGLKSMAERLRKLAAGPLGDAAVELERARAALGRGEQR